jgi:hypothetical protein
MAKYSFSKGCSYTRAQVAEEIGLPLNRRRGGNWDTGYDRFDGAFFIFCNVGVAGRTGHDYANRWENDQLVWQAKNGTRLSQPTMQAIASAKHPVHVFWRTGDKDPFTYAGAGTPMEVQDTTPVRIRWAF